MKATWQLVHKEGQKMVHQTDKPMFEADEQLEFDFYLQWEWPDHIETAMRRLLWISLVESAEPGFSAHKHTAFIRWQIATFPESPPAVLDFLATLTEADLLVRIAENPQTWPVTLARLARSEHTDVRIAVADNANTPIDVMQLLVSDACPDVRYSMAENPALPARMLQELAADENAYVAHRATRTMARRNPAAVEQFPQRQQQRPQQRKLG
jgi:hypothetical protein